MWSCALYNETMVIGSRKIILLGEIHIPLEPSTLERITGDVLEVWIAYLSVGA